MYLAARKHLPVLGRNYIKSEIPFEFIRNDPGVNNIQPMT